MGERTGKAKVRRKIVGQDKESLISERENKTKQTKHNKKAPQVVQKPSLITSRLMANQTLGNGYFGETSPQFYY